MRGQRWSQTKAEIRGAHLATKLIKHVDNFSHIKLAIFVDVPAREKIRSESLKHVSHQTQANAQESGENAPEPEDYVATEGTVRRASEPSETKSNAMHVGNSRGMLTALWR